MEYEELVCKMLSHADDTQSPENWTELVKSLAFGIAQISANCSTLQMQEDMLESIFSGIRLDARTTFLETNALSADELLQRTVTVGPIQ